MRPFDGKYQNLQKLPHTFFMLAVTMPEILMFQICYHQKVCQGHGVQFLQWDHLMANVQIYKSSNHFKDLNVSNFWPSKSSSKSKSIISSMMANIKIYKSRTMHFYACSNVFRDINLSYFLPSRSRSGSRNIIFAMRSINGKYQNLQQTSHTFLHYL